MRMSHFTERPYQDVESGYFGSTGRSITDLDLRNKEDNPELGARLYNRYIEEMGTALS